MEKRVQSIDVVRGLVMVIMALDHVRDLMHVTSATQSPTNLATTTPLLFFTRWITYLCAPAFVFLAGTSAYLSFKKTCNLEQSRNFLLKRGFYLIALEFIVVNFALFFDFAYHTLLFEVIATIGFGFIVLGLSLKASAKTLGFIGLIIIFCHNFFTLIPFAQGSIIKSILQPLFSLSVYPFSGRVFVMAYPPIPWLGIILVGFAAGKFFEYPPEKRKFLFLKISLATLLVFFVIRFINIYGDPVPWAVQKNDVYIVLSFINVAKYPPSLQFCLITLGIMFGTMALAERSSNAIVSVMAVYGKVPLFYFIVHFFLIHTLMLAMLFFQGFSWGKIEFASGGFGRPKGLQSGVDLWIVYLIWIGVVCILYKPCVWFGNYKKENHHWLLKYI